MQLPGQSEVAARFDRLIHEALPNPRGLDASRSLLRAHASLMRQLATDLVDDELVLVVVALTDGGIARLAETAPVHLRQVSALFVSKLTDDELSTLTTALDKVAIDCQFG